MHHFTCKRRFVSGLLGTWATIVLLLPATAHAQWWACPPETKWGTTKEYLHKETMRNYAQFLHDAAKRTREQIPSLSPDEEQWLEQELSANDLMRQHDATKTKEYRKRKTRNILKQNISCLSKISNSDNSLSVREEVNCWAQVAFNYSDTNFSYAIGSLQRDGIIHIKSLPKNDAVNHAQSNCALHARAIREWIVLPYLRDTLDW